MSKILSYSELRQIKDSLPEGAIHQIANSLNVTVETVWNYFGGHSYKDGESCGIHLESGHNGGYVEINDTTILDMALDILNKK